MVQLPSLWSQTITQNNAREDCILDTREALINLIRQIQPSPATVEEIPDDTIQWEATDNTSTDVSSPSVWEDGVSVLPKEGIREHTEVCNYASSPEELLPQTLANHAHECWQRFQHGVPRNYSTVPCVVLKDRDNHVKKFMFANIGLVNPAVRQAAYMRGYQIIKTRAVSHAEAALLRFLAARRASGPNVQQQYTHLAGMGCSRLHCRECNAIFDLVLGQGYTAVTAAIDSNGNVLTGAAAVNNNELLTRRYYLHGLIQQVLGAFTNRNIIPSYTSFVPPQHLQNQSFIEED